MRIIWPLNVSMLFNSTKRKYKVRVGLSVPLNADYSLCFFLYCFLRHLARLSCESLTPWILYIPENIKNKMHKSYDHSGINTSPGRVSPSPKRTFKVNQHTKHQPLLVDFIAWTYQGHPCLNCTLPGPGKKKRNCRCLIWEKCVEKKGEKSTREYFLYSKLSDLY